MKLTFKKASPRERERNGDTSDPPWYHLLVDGSRIGDVIQIPPPNGYGKNTWLGETVCGTRTREYGTRKEASTALLKLSQTIHEKHGHVGFRQRFAERAVKFLGPQDELNELSFEIDNPRGAYCDITLIHTNFEAKCDYSITCLFEMCSLLSLEANCGSHPAAIPSGIAMDILDLYREMGGQVVRE